VTPADLLRREVSHDGARPLLTWYDDETAARVELSVVTTANWVAKLAGLLTDEHDVQPGVVVSVALPLHWQTACVLLAVWTCGGAVDLTGDGDLRVGSGDDVDVQVVPDPMGMTLSRLVGSQPDDFAPLVPVDPAASALRVDGRMWTHEQLAADAMHAAVQHALDRATRVLTTRGYDTVDGLDAGLLAPLAAGGSVVLVSNPDEGRLRDRCATENVSHTAGVDVIGVPRLA